MENSKISFGNKASQMSYNATPNTSKFFSIMHGDNASPTTDGTLPSLYIQRVDKSATEDSPAYLIPALYSVHKRLDGGTGWCYSGLFYLEDQSSTGNAQSVAVAGMAYSKNNADVWGVYGDAFSFSPYACITGAEFDATNKSGQDYLYDEIYPVNNPFSCAVWAFGGGEHKNSFAYGLGAGKAETMFGVGLYMKTWSVEKYAIDIQAQPHTLIHFKYGASSDGTGRKIGGIGLDAGKQAYYGYGQNQGAVHLRDHAICFGHEGLGHIKYNALEGKLEFWYNGQRRGYVNCNGLDHEL